MKNKIWIATLALIIFACSGNKTEFDETQTGLEYRFINHNKDAAQTKKNDVLLIDLIYTSESGDTLFSSFEQNRDYLRKLEEPRHPGGSFEDALAMMHLGDSAIFRIDAYNFFKYSERQEILPKGIEKGDKILFYVKLKEILKTDDYSEHLVSKYHKNEEIELELLHDYLDRTNVKNDPLPNGVYYVKLSDGTGKKPENGSVVKIHYSGYFIDGKPFDTSYGKSPFKFVVGQEQVIKGLDEGIKQMQEGEKARLIIPSKLAYGEKGTEGILPVSTLIFEIELISVI
jgi:FKBP-type peptidyl-prolyl cis-trans isomerase FkpA